MFRNQSGNLCADAEAIAERIKRLPNEEVEALEERKGILRDPTWARLCSWAGRVRYAWRPAARRTGVRVPFAAARPPTSTDGAATFRDITNSTKSKKRKDKKMNPSPQTSTSPNLDLLRQAIQEYQPDPSRIPFSNLKPFHDSIMELRGKNASYAAIADLLIQNGVKTSRARVAEYGRIVLEGGKRRKRAQTTPAVNIPAAPQSAPDVAKKTVPTAAPTVTSNVPVPPSENSPHRSRGPHIAKVELLPASELDY
jgi:hypothetical protein